MNAKTLLIALAAGIASAIAVLASVRAGGAGVPLLSIAALPVYLVALGWGTHAGGAASIAAIFAAALLISWEAAIIVGLALTIPASIIGHQANLAQQTDEGTLEWYPLSRLMFNLSVILAVSIVLVGYLMDYTSYANMPELTEAIREYLRRNPPPQALSDEEMLLITQTVFKLLPFTFAGIWLIIHIINLQLAALVCRTSGLLARPKDDIPATASLPRMALVILIVSLIGTLVLDGALHSVAAVFAGTFLMAFALLGLAATHLRARSNPANILFLVLSYILILLFFLPLFFFAIGGIARVLTPSSPSLPKTGNDNS